jgi:AcrR family transcriptional regulator
VTGSDELSAPLRADARRNREHIIGAARALFAARGTDVPMEEIARTAGVGVGTLYRRFPDRDSLIRAVSMDNFQRLRELARTIDDEEPDPGVALRQLLRSTLELRLALTLSLASPTAAKSFLDSPTVAEIRTELLAIIGRLVHRAQAAGVLRHDIDVGDVVLAVVALARLGPPTGSALAELAFERLFTVTLDGMRADPDRPVTGRVLPGRPMTVADVDELRGSGVLNHPSRSGA